MMRVMLVDDEQAARERLRQMLEPMPGLEIVGEAADGEEAIRKVVELHPDLLLLDIQMPGCSGLEVAACLPAPRPEIVFCTAFDQYAVDAFEINAVDYLLKPVNRSGWRAPSTGFAAAILKKAARWNARSGRCAQGIPACWHGAATDTGWFRNRMSSTSFPKAASLSCARASAPTSSTRRYTISRNVSIRPFSSASAGPRS